MLSFPAAPSSLSSPVRIVDLLIRIKRPFAIWSNGRAGFKRGTQNSTSSKSSRGKRSSARASAKRFNAEESSRIPLASASVMNHSSGPLTLGHVNIEAVRCSTSRRLVAPKEEYPDIVFVGKNVVCRAARRSFFLALFRALRRRLSKQTTALFHGGCSGSKQ
ncbi:hypothetical protein HN011_011274 [Eciton burchellii]|nr:hypothetical protein HN011_011274 [Eciton burchellii]